MNSQDLKDKAQKVYYWLRHPGDSLSQRVAHGGVWVFGLRIVNRGFGLTRTVVLARLLAPNDFGLFGIAMLALSSLERFSKTGFDQALIQRKEETESYLDTAWTVQVIRGLVLGGILVAGAPLVGLFFEEPRAVLIVRVLGSVEVLKSLRNIGVVYFRKELEFHKQFIYQFSGTVADLSVALPFAFIFRSVWALIFGLLARNLVKSALSYKVHDFRPHIKLNLKKAKELITFGRWIFGMSIIGFIATQADDIFLGKFLGTTALGIYQLAYRISNAPSNEITHVISSITFPAYSKVQDNVQKLRAAFYKVVEVTTSLSFPLGAGIFFLAPEFVHLFLGTQWIRMIPALRVLVISGVIRSITAIGGPVFWGVGEPKRDFWLNLIRTVALWAAIYPLTVLYGITGTSLAVLIGLVTLFFFWIFTVSETIQDNIFEIVRRLSFPFFSTFAMSLVVILLKYYLPRPLGYIHFALIVFAGAVTYIFYNFIGWHYYKAGPITKIVELLSNNA